MSHPSSLPVRVPFCGQWESTAALVPHISTVWILPKTNTFHFVSLPSLRKYNQISFKYFFYNHNHETFVWIQFRLSLVRHQTWLESTPFSNCWIRLFFRVLVWHLILKSCIYVFVYEYTRVCRYPQRTEVDIGLPGTEVWMVVSYSVGARNQTESSARAGHAPDP